jgi:hypothetical protein
MTVVTGGSGTIYFPFISTAKSDEPEPDGFLPHIAVANSGKCF